MRRYFCYIRSSHWVHWFYILILRQGSLSTRQAWVNKGDVYKIITGHERLPTTKRQVEIETDTPRHSPGADFLLPADCIFTRMSGRRNLLLLRRCRSSTIQEKLPPRTTSLKRCHFAYIWGKDAAKLLNEYWYVLLRYIQEEIGKGVSFSKCGFQKGDNRMCTV